MPKIEFKGLWQKMPITKEECQLFFDEVCTLNAIEDIFFEILICDDKESRKLNHEFLNSNSPTNVLSFVAEEASLMQNKSDIVDTINFIGSLALSFETLEREAFLYGQEEKDYAKQLLIHGFAHLLGYDHSDEMDIFCNKALEECS